MTYANSYFELTDLLCWLLFARSQGGAKSVYLARLGMCQVMICVHSHIPTVMSQNELTAVVLWRFLQLTLSFQRFMLPFIILIMILFALLDIWTKNAQISRKPDLWNTLHLILHLLNVSRFTVSCILITTECKLQNDDKFRKKF